MYLPISVLLAIAQGRLRKTLGGSARIWERREGRCRRSRPRPARATLWWIGSPAAGAGALLLLTAASLPEFAQTQTADARDLQAARELFAHYVTLERRFDPALAQLYADDAVIRNRRRSSDGELRERTVAAAQYKQLIGVVMPMAKARADSNSYSECRYAAEARGVRITCQRFSRLKKYTSPLSLLVAPVPGRQWQILEEQSESRT